MSRTNKTDKRRKIQKDHLFTNVIIQSYKYRADSFLTIQVIRHRITLHLHSVITASRNLSLIQIIMNCVWYKEMLNNV